MEDGRFVNDFRQDGMNVRDNMVELSLLIEYLD